MVCRNRAHSLFPNLHSLRIPYPCKPQPLADDPGHGGDAAQYNPYRHKRLGGRDGRVVARAQHHRAADQVPGQQLNLRGSAVKKSNRYGPSSNARPRTSLPAAEPPWRPAAGRHPQSRRGKAVRQDVAGNEPESLRRFRGAATNARGHRRFQLVAAEIEQPQGQGEHPDEHHSSEPAEPV